MQQAVLSGKTLHLKQLARVAKADKSLIEMLQDMVALEEDLMEAHKVPEFLCDFMLSLTSTCH